MRCLLLLTVLCAAGCSDSGAPPRPPSPAQRTPEPLKAVPERFPDNFTIIFTREYGLWMFRVCILQVDLFERSRTAFLECQSVSDPDGRVKRDLSYDDAARLRQLVRAADLYGTDPVGLDLTPTDGVFDTLRFRPAGGGRAVVVVTSGNSGFAEHAARRDLLTIIHRLHADLLEDIR